MVLDKRGSGRPRPSEGNWQALAAAVHFALQGGIAFRFRRLTFLHTRARNTYTSPWFVFVFVAPFISTVASIPSFGPCTEKSVINFHVDLSTHCQIILQQTIEWEWFY